KGPEYIEGNGKYNPDSYFERIETEGIIGNKDTDVIDNGDGTYEVTTTSGYIFKITLVPSKDNVEDIQIEHIGKVDGPRIRNLKVTNKTTNSITVEVETANTEGATYTYYYKKDGETDWKKAEEIKEKTYTFSGLESNVIYNIKVRVEKDGKAVEKEVSTITGELPEGAVQFSPVEWKSGQASTTITTSETGYTLQYQIGEITEGSWTNTTSGSVIGNLQHGQIVYGRLFDGTNGSKTANIDVQDEIEPQQAMISLSGTSTNTEGSITATVTLTDNESGINTTASKWIYNTTSGAIGENESSYNNNFSSNEQTITLKSTTAGTYYLHVLTVDNAGNKKETISNAVTVEKALVADGSYNEDKGVNTPKLGSGMTPIKWKGSTWIETTGNDPDWYDYTAKKWANAKTSDGSMWVWIPRYAYSITSGYHSSSAGNIDVEFMKGLTNETSTGRTSFQNSSGQGKWNIHPAFNYGQTVSGIWVAKFEASRSNATSSSSGGNNTIKIQPGVSSWTDIAVNDIFKTCRNYNTLLNSHMMKNTEWGAVAYLSKSKYGINGEVAINSFNNYTGGGSDNSYVDNTDQSTTGNVWGIYDMSGGKYEYVAAYVNNGSSSLNTYGSSLVSASSYMKDIYTASKDTSSENYNESSSKYGDALYETSSDNSGYNSWYDDYSLFPSKDEPFFRRGGAKDDRTHAGVFSFDYSDGDEYYASTFRPVLI
ncbi:MAG: fibronectin type III domain-containing protein, partial [Clostridia bacterium]|nr:fibronectin type III domain-containing protein [Clostridia bacterium]